ncbi:unnamed protein product [Amoebophrya sp. A25]|nr:unnamed protein product [Amoebophrya sp. A25]|eukprot:GSA25T00027420001.1
MVWCWNSRGQRWLTEMAIGNLHKSTTSFSSTTTTTSAAATTTASNDDTTSTAATTNPTAPSQQVQDAASSADSANLEHEPEAPATEGELVAAKAQDAELPETSVQEDDQLKGHGDGGGDHTGPGDAGKEGHFAEENEEDEDHVEQTEATTGGHEHVKDEAVGADSTSEVEVKELHKEAEEREAEDTGEDRRIHSTI